jgi:hypothetical protein
MPHHFLIPATKGKRAIFWALFLFVCSQVALAAYLAVRRPEVRDPAFGLRIRSLQERLAEKPGAPLVLVLGSSRALNGVWPAHMPVRLKAADHEPLIYNFAFAGSGSVRELMTFRRLRAAGIKPDWLLVETWPVLWPEEGTFAERGIIVQDDLRWTDLPVLLRYVPGTSELLTKSIKENLLPLVSYRSRLLHSLAQVLLPQERVAQFDRELHAWYPLDGTGWLPRRHLPNTSEELRRKVEDGRWYTAPLLNPLRISTGSDRALRDLLNECQASGIQVALFLMPEHSECRRWYSPQTRALVACYLTQLSKEYQIPAIDMRNWAPDEDFADYCHMAPWGAEPFSKRFARQVLEPWLNGQPLCRDLLIEEGDGERQRSSAVGTGTAFKD